MRRAGRRAGAVAAAVAGLLLTVSGGGSGGVGGAASGVARAESGRPSTGERRSGGAGSGVAEVGGRAAWSPAPEVGRERSGAATASARRGRRGTAAAGGGGADLRARDLAAVVHALGVQIMLAGQMSTVDLVGDELRIESTAAGAMKTLALGGVARERLVAAAREALAHDERRRGCGGGETFVSVTVDGKTGYSALCPTAARAGDASWRALLDVLRPLIGAL